MRGVLTRCRRLFLSYGNASPSYCAMIDSIAVDGSRVFLKHRPNCLQPSTAGKRTKVVRTESWIRRSLSRSLWGCQGRARTMREKFEMKINVASRIDRVPFTVWIKRLHRTDGNPVRCCSGGYRLET